MDRRTSPALDGSAEALAQTRPISLSSFRWIFKKASLWTILMVTRLIYFQRPARITFLALHAITTMPRNRRVRLIMLCEFPTTIRLLLSEGESEGLRYILTRIITSGLILESQPRI